MQRTLRKPIKELEPVPIDPKGEHLIDWFWSLDAGRDGNGFGPNPLKYSEILAWGQLKGIQLEPWEVEVMMALDEERRKRKD